MKFLEHEKDCRYHSPNKLWQEGKCGFLLLNNSFITQKDAQEWHEMETSQNEEENNNFCNCKSTDWLENPGHTNGTPKPLTPGNKNIHLNAFAFYIPNISSIKMVKPSKQNSSQINRL